MEKMSAAGAGIAEMELVTWDGGVGRLIKRNFGRDMSEIESWRESMVLGGVWSWVRMSH